MIRFVEPSEIDRKKWDACVCRSLAGHVYATTWYLDLTAPEWAGIVKGDYDAVMPLPLKKKYGLWYAYKPPFAQQLGVYAPFRVEPALLDEFFREIPKHIKYINFCLNYTNETLNLNYRFTQYVNYELHLNKGYEQLRKEYSANTIRNIKKSNGMAVVMEGISCENLVRLKKQNPDPENTSGYYDWLKSFTARLVEMGKAEIIGAGSDGNICSASLFLHFGKRIYYLIPVSGEEGRERSAMFAVIDHVIRKYAEKDMILDFEGSVIPGVARFFAGFGATPVNYHAVAINNLPVFLRVFKK